MFTRKLRLGVAAGWVASLLAATPAISDGFSGAYLAARQAFSQNDYSEAAKYYTRALVNDPTNIELLENTIIAFLAKGDIERALAVSRRLVGLEQDFPIANMLLLVEAADAGNYDVAGTLLSNGEVAGPLVDGLALAWVLVGQGNMTNAPGQVPRGVANPWIAEFW